MTLLLATPPTGHADEFGGFRLASLQSLPPYRDIPVRLVDWLRQNPQDVLVFNACDEADAAIPFIPSDTRIIYAVHDTAERYFSKALQREGEIDAILAVSDAVAARFRERIRSPAKLSVVWNGTVLPLAIDVVLASKRADDLIFLGGDAAAKGAYDVLELWKGLAEHRYAGRLHWFGDMGEAFRARIAALPGAGQIAVYGRQPRRAIFEAASRSKVMLMLSRVEPFGMATVECVGMGCIPVAWDIETGTKEIVGADEGLFVPLGDYDALAASVRTAVDVHSTRFRGIATRVRRDFSEEAMWGRYAAILDGLSTRQPAIRPLAGHTPPPYRRPVRLYQFIPARLRKGIRVMIGKSPRLGYLLRDFRGR
ncbi:glycosyltransferase involved in cell wall biosynthesis [Labrys monachus]|uniref:Glycosyltransferase involved in cell wall biosynthesis n=1 Tax=Labrys monachus TaxID=217067 RepID=A0ABU0FKA7_9HYPH|nr:glycosyltransferase involved in cell wall biosynthesis [Labrys monachus]